MVWLGFMPPQPLLVIYSKSSLYICIKYIGFGLVLWHINPYWLLDAKSSLCICIKYI